MERSSLITSAMPARRKLMWQKALFWQRSPIISSSIFRGCVSITISLKMKKSTLGGNSPWISTFILTRWMLRKELALPQNTITLLRVLFCIMVQLSSGITSATSRSQTPDGLSSMTSVWENSIPMISKPTALEENTGGEKVRVLICWSTRRSTRHHFILSSILKRRNILCSASTLWMIRLLCMRRRKKPMRLKNLPLWKSCRKIRRSLHRNNRAGNSLKNRRFLLS